MKKKGVKGQKTRKMNIRMKILLPVLIIMLVVRSGMGALMFLIGESAYTQMGVEQSKMAASIATTMIDGKSIAKIGAGAETSSLYASQLKQLREIKETCGILYMYTIYEENGELIGFDIELAKAVGEKLGLEVAFQVINWDTKVFELESKAIDVIWNGMTITDKIKEETSVTIPYLKNKQVAVIRVEDKDKYKTTEDMLDAVICVESGSAGQICVEVEE